MPPVDPDGLVSPPACCPCGVVPGGARVTLLHPVLGGHLPGLSGPFRVLKPHPGDSLGGSGGLFEGSPCGLQSMGSRRVGHD